MPAWDDASWKAFSRWDSPRRVGPLMFLLSDCREMTGPI